jgi:manganese oxidase
VKRVSPVISLVAAACVSAMAPYMANAQASGATRTYYVAADDVPWDYLPGGVDQITGRRRVDTAFFARGEPKIISHSYRKVLLREYTDGSFGTLKLRPPEWEHLGFLGPLLRAVVGDTIRVVFRNNARRPFSLHPHGVSYGKDSEGAPYVDGSSAAQKQDDAVPPRGSHVYVWPVPERAGPGPMDRSSVLWMYHSHTDEVRDVNTGLMGPIIVTAREQARPDGRPLDADREFVMMFAQTHEEDSWYASDNKIPIENPPFPPAALNQGQNFFPYFVTFSINGYTHGSLPLGALTMRKSERVRWYVFSSTNDSDLHTPHWHGNTVLIGGMRNDVGAIAPMQMLVADMQPDNVGTWLFHCHVSFHLQAGMAARYAVVE